MPLSPWRLMVLSGGRSVWSPIWSAKWRFDDPCVAGVIRLDPLKPGAGQAIWEAHAPLTAYRYLDLRS